MLVQAMGMVQELELALEQQVGMQLPTALYKLRDETIPCIGEISEVH